MSGGVLDVHDVERPRVALPVDDGAHSSQVTAARDHAQVTCGNERMAISGKYPSSKKVDWARKA